MYSEVKDPTDASPRARAFVLTTALQDITRQYPFGEVATPEAALLMLAQALGSSPLWRTIPHAAMVVRPAPRPMLGILGHFDAEAQARVETLHGQLEGVLSRLRYVDYAAAEDDCERLARQLVDRFGRKELSSFCYAPMPRGGLIVLGMLSYMLGLDHEQLEPPYRPDVPLVVVDDCALTGLRFGTFLKRCASHRVVFAALYAHRDLRAAIEASEPRVTACVSGRNLHDHAPDRLGERYVDWRARWQERSGGRCYWIGLPDHICFAWNEPDVTFWNPVSEQDERGWRVVPPAYCLKNRPTPGAGTVNRLQVQPDGRGRLRPAAHVLFADLGGEIIIADTVGETTFSLDELSAELWRAVVAHGNRADVVRTLLAVYDVDETTLTADVDSFAEDLLTRGLLEHHDASNSRG